MKLREFVNPFWGPQLGPQLRLHCRMIKKALEPQLRFKGRWGQHGPLEWLIGSGGCVNCHSKPLLKIPAGGQVCEVIARVQRLQWGVALDWPEAFPMDKETGLRRHDGEEDAIHKAWERLASYEDARTRQWWNSSHKRIRTMGDMRVVVGPYGVNVNFSLICDGSSWGAYTFMRGQRVYDDFRIDLTPQDFVWLQTKESFPMFLNRCCDLLDTIIERKRRVA